VLSLPVNERIALFEKGKALMMRVATFTDIQKRLEDVFGSGSVVILYDVGKGCGKKSCLRAKHDKNVDGMDLLLAVAESKESEGWGVLEFENINFNTGEAKILVKNSFEAREYGKSTRPVCHFLRGYLSGVLSVVLDRELDLDEVHCIAKGDRFCEFQR